MVNVLIVEDSRISREMFERQISAMPGYRIIASIENAANAEIVCLSNRIDLVLMDICTADDESGLEAAARIRKDHPEIQIIMMTSMPEQSFIRKAKAAGCSSFWYKEAGDVSLPEICEATMAGKRIWPEEAPAVTIGAVRSDELTAREIDVIRGLTGGKKYEEIAAELNVSPNTVKYHMKNILQKTGFRSTVQLVAEVVGKRLILPKY